jgi:hypothetical protein
VRRKQEEGEEKRREREKKRRRERKKFQTWKFLKKIKDNLQSWLKNIFVKERYMPNYK